MRYILTLLLFAVNVLAQSTGTTATLSWTASADAVAVVGYEVERCSGAACSNFVKIGAVTVTSYADPGPLLWETSYSWRVRASDAANNKSIYSNVASATVMSAPDITAPTAPGTLIVVIPPPSSSLAAPSLSLPAARKRVNKAK